MKGIEAVEEQVKTSRSHGNWNYSPYMHGMANGLICALATMKGEEPEYLTAPEKWLCDFPAPTEPAEAMGTVGIEIRANAGCGAEILKDLDQIKEKHHPEGDELQSDDLLI